MSTATMEKPQTQPLILSARHDEMMQKHADGKHLEPLNILQIQELIPHRYPFLLLDAITHHIEGKYIAGYKNVTINEPFFQGHFPHRPIMPGVLQIEALAQLGAVLVGHMLKVRGDGEKLAVLAGVDNFRFRRMVTPGDQLRLFGEITRFRLPIGKSTVWGEVNGEVALEGELTFSLVDEG